MKVAIILGRGIEGCGVTRASLEEKKWYDNNGIHCDMYAALDKKWGRKDSQVHNIHEYNNSEIKDIVKKLNEEYTYVIYQSLPAKKGYSEEYQNLFLEEMVKGVTKPIKIAIQNDHKAQSLSRNFKIWETMAEMDAVMTYSLGSAFGKKMKEHNPDVPVIKMTNGFDFDFYKQYWKKDQLRRFSYFGRFAGFKDPIRMIEMQPLLEKAGIVGEMRGIERSIGSLELFYSDRDDRKNSYRKNIHEVSKKNPAPEVQTADKIWIYGPYNRLEGIEELSNSMFGSDFYNLDADAYGDMMEFAMCEIIACGSIPVFDKHWADNCTHENGTLFADMKDFAIYSDKNNLQTAVDEMEELANDEEKRNARRESCFRIAKEHCDNSVVYKKMHEDILSVEKRDPEKVVQEKKVEMKSQALW